MKKRYTEEQIIGFLRDGETGIGVKDLCRKHGFSEASYYLWKSKFGGMSVSDAKRLRELETENARLKKLLAESVLENEVAREALRKNVWSAPRLQALNVDEDSLHKCIRPLASELRLQPGHDEIRAQRS